MSSPSLRHTLLIVDDDPLLSHALTELLSSGSLDVVAAQTGAEATDICQTRTVDVVILDQRLPDAEGHTLCPSILEANERTKIIFVTGYPSFNNAMKAIKAGAFDYLSKPFEFEQLRLAVDRCLATLRLERLGRLRDYRQAQESDQAVVVGASACLAETSRLVGLAAESEAPVLITGETGSGKSLVAKSIHFRSGRRGGELVTVNCAALPESLIEAELFGHEKGAFTGAVAAREGVFEMAAGGTLFLDEIGEMPLGLQPKLLNVLEERTVRRLGGRATRRVDFRLITATNGDLEGLVRKGLFRADLFYRINILRIHVAPLRERPEDIPALCAYLLERMEARGRDARLSPDEITRLMEYPWPGNVRELGNVLERALLTQDGRIRPSLLLASSQAGAGPSSGRVPAQPGGMLSLEEVEKRHVTLALESTSWNLTRAARGLGISLSTLKRKLRGYGLASSSSGTAEHRSTGGHARKGEDHA